MQYVHFALQNGTERYTPSGCIIFSILSCISLVRGAPGVHLNAMLLPRRSGARILLPSVLLLAVALAVGLLVHRLSVFAAERRAPVHAAITPVVVELFTSEGCSSCPPADALLARLQHDQPVPSAEVLALEEHVDYWDGLGWHDRFSSADITARQSGYARRFQLDSNYTPQMVVDGNAQFVGIDKGQAVQAITRAVRQPKLSLSLQALMLDGNRVSGQLALPTSAPSDADLYAALVQPMASTQVLHGENGGHTLNHVSIVRSLQHITGARSKGPVDFSLALPNDLSSSNLRVVVFLQAKGQGPILGATTSTLPSGDDDAAIPQLN